MKKKIETKRLVIEVPEELHNDIKIRATFRHETIKKYILQAIAFKIAEEDKFK
jgi:hypothetical protein